MANIWMENQLGKGNVKNLDLTFIILPAAIHFFIFLMYFLLHNEPNLTIGIKIKNFIVYLISSQFLFPIGIQSALKNKFYDSGSVTVSGAKLHCWKAGGHGEETYLEVVENSCNTGFVNLGLKLGKDKLFNYIDLFGFGKKTGVDLNGEANGIIFNKDKIGDLELATTAFGQGVSVTPIHLTV